MKQNKIELDRQRFNYVIEQDFMMKKGLSLSLDVDANKKGQ